MNNYNIFKVCNTSFGTNLLLRIQSKWQAVSAFSGPRRILALAATALAMALPLPCFATPSDDGLYELTIEGGGNAKISGYHGLGGALSISNLIYSGGQPYTIDQIGTGAFRNLPSLTSVTIPSTVTNIGSYAFGGCTSLAAVYYLGKQPTLGGSDVYSDISPVPTIYYTVYADPFTYYTVPGSVGGGVTCYSPGALTGDHVFVSANSLCNLRASANSGYAFINWKNSDGIIVGGYAYSQYITATNSIWVTANFVPLVNGADPATDFYWDLDVVSQTATLHGYAGSQTNVVIPGVVPDAYGSLLYPVVAIGTNSFANQTNLVSVTIPVGVTNIRASAFANCTSLNKAVIPATVTSIGNSTFANCSVLASVKIPNSVTTIENRAFFASGLTNIVLPNSLSIINTYVFGNCTNLTSVTIPPSVTQISSDVYGAFEGCSRLPSVTIPGSVTTIGQRSFGSCTALTNVTLMYGIASINEAAFSSCGLSSVTFPASINAIGQSVFIGNPLNTVYFLGNRPYIQLSGNPSFGDNSTASSASFYYVAGTTGWTNANWGSIPYMTPMYSVTLSDNPGGASVLTPPAGFVLTNFTYYSDGLTHYYYPSNAFYGSSVTAAAVPAYPGLIFTNWTESGAAVSTSTNYTFALTTNRNLTANFANPYTWTLNPDGISYSLWGCNYGGNVVIPSTYNGYPVTGIYMGAFSGLQTSLKSVTLPDTITSIPAALFANFTGVTNVLLGNNVTDIGSQAFQGCVNLKNAVIPNSVTNIGSGAFSGCSRLASVSMGSGVQSGAFFSGCPGLTNITVDANNPAYASLNGVLFNKTLTTLIQYPSGNPAASYSIPGTVTNLAGSAFYGSAGLGSVAIPNSVVSIGGSAFSASGLTNLVIPNSIANINSYVFNSCTNLTSVTIPGSVTNLGNLAFGACSSLQSAIFLGDRPGGLNGQFVFSGISSSVLTVYYVDGTAGWNGFIGPDNGSPMVRLYTIATSANPPGLGTAIVSNAIAGNYCASNSTCAAVATPNSGYAVANWSVNGNVANTLSNSYSFTAQSNATLVANFSSDPANFNFMYDSQHNVAAILNYLGSSSVLYLPGLVANSGVAYTVTALNGLMGPNSGNIKNVIIPNSITNVGGSVFMGMGSLTNVTLGSGITAFNPSALSGANNFQSINVDAANPNYASLNGILFNKTLTQLVRCPAANAAASGNFTIPGSVVSIGDSAFTSCHGLTRVTIPGSVTNVGNYAFSGSGLTNAVINSASIGNYAFNCPLTSLTLGNSVTSIGANAFYYCTGLQDLVLPDSVTSIGDAAFYGCGFTNVVIGRGLGSIGFDVFSDCVSLTGVAIPNTLTNIGNGAFSSCSHLARIVIPASVTSIDNGAFFYCSALRTVWFNGNKPAIGPSGLYFNVPNAALPGGNDGLTVYYLPGTTGWAGYTQADNGAPVVCWNLQTGGTGNNGKSPGVRADGAGHQRFGFDIVGPTNATVVVESSTSLGNPVWVPVSTNQLTGGTSYFSDLQWTNFGKGFYRFRTP